MEKSIEQTFEELEELMEKLENPDTSLEDSFAYYEAGMKLGEYRDIENYELRV